MTKRTISVGAVFLLGCAVGGASSQLVVPKASAQQAATLPAWEYKCAIPEGSITSLANQLGAQRWELATVRPRDGDRGEIEDIYCFKRPRL